MQTKSIQGMKNVKGLNECDHVPLTQIAPKGTQALDTHLEYITLICHDKTK